MDIDDACMCMYMYQRTGHLGGRQAKAGGQVLLPTPGGLIYSAFRICDSIARGKENPRGKYASVLASASFGYSTIAG